MHMWALPCHASVTISVAVLKESPQRPIYKYFSLSSDLRSLSSEPKSLDHKVLSSRKVLVLKDPLGSSPLITKSSKIVKALRKVLVLEDQFTRPCPWTSSPCPWITSPCPRALSPCPQTLSPWQHHWLQLSTQITISSKAGHVVKSQNNTHIYIFKKTERTHVLHKTYW